MNHLLLLERLPEYDGYDQAPTYLGKVYNTFPSRAERRDWLNDIWIGRWGAEDYDNSVDDEAGNTTRDIVCSVRRIWAHQISFFVFRARVSLLTVAQARLKSLLRICSGWFTFAHP